MLRKGAEIVSAATLRVFGTGFAELPFVATKEGFRRAGNCRRLIKVREAASRRTTLVHAGGRGGHGAEPWRAWGRGRGAGSMGQNGGGQRAGQGLCWRL